MFKCSCGWEPKLIGEGHCSKHHTNYRVLNEGGRLCSDCKEEKMIEDLKEWRNALQKEDLNFIFNRKG